ncbi:MAG: hypothetical protein K0Q83_1862 [Deltaproteobacteria bacterium]|jgi:hypothetical protein|nr:hypothetical protein [Deltaproteobacteria bacterium]
MNSLAQAKLTAVRVSRVLTPRERSVHSLALPSHFLPAQHRASGQVSWKVTALCRRGACCKSTEARRPRGKNAYVWFLRTSEKDH